MDGRHYFGIGISPNFLSHSIYLLFNDAVYIPPFKGASSYAEMSLLIQFLLPPTCASVINKIGLLLIALFLCKFIQI